MDYTAILCWPSEADKSQKLLIALPVKVLINDPREHEGRLLALLTMNHLLHYLIRFVIYWRILLNIV